MLKIVKNICVIKKYLYIYTVKQKTIKTNIMIRTTSFKHYKELKSKGIKVELVTKQDLNK